MANVYFDNNATTAVDSRVLEAMLPLLSTQNGNPTSRHVYGRSARDAVEHARAQVAEACGAYSSQVVFTGNGTEANNFAIKGMAGNLPSAQILSSAIEHPCVTRPALMTQQLGYSSKPISVDVSGKLSLENLRKQLTLPTSLVSMMLANNETGVIQEAAIVA